MQPPQHEEQIQESKKRRVETQPQVTDGGSPSGDQRSERNVKAILGAGLLDGAIAGYAVARMLTLLEKKPEPAVAYAPQHFLNFLPLPQGQGSLRPAVLLAALAGSTAAACEWEWPWLCPQFSSCTCSSTGINTGS